MMNSAYPLQLRRFSQHSEKLRLLAKLSCVKRSPNHRNIKAVISMFYSRDIDGSHTMSVILRIIR